MTPIQFASLLIRIFSGLMFVFAAGVLTEVAYELFTVLYSTSSQTEVQRVVLLAMYVVRFLIYFCTGTAFLIFTKPLGKLLTKDLG